MNPNMNTDSRPLRIGVTSRSGEDGWIRRNSKNYLATLRQYGAEPVVLSPDRKASLSGELHFEPDTHGRLPAEMLAHLDGLILSGGGDVDPVHFQSPLAGAEPETIDKKRDALEMHLSQAALALDMPLFGICRGCQVLNVAAGGRMVQHFPGHRSSKTSTNYHDVHVLTGTRLAQIVNEPVFPVNTFHHQGMDRLSIAPLFIPAAVAAPDSWLIEAFESPSHAWVLGVQWHPERIFELGNAHRQLWDSFVAACKARHSTIMP
jgi:putative glutamine amidotransferase